MCRYGHAPAPRGPHLLYASGCPCLCPHLWVDLPVRVWVPAICESTYIHEKGLYIDLQWAGRNSTKQVRKRKFSGVSSQLGLPRSGPLGSVPLVKLHWPVPVTLGVLESRCHGLQWERIWGSGSLRALAAGSWDSPHDWLIGPLAPSSGIIILALLPLLLPHPLCQTALGTGREALSAQGPTQPPAKPRNKSVFSAQPGPVALACSGHFLLEAALVLPDLTVRTCCFWRSCPVWLLAGSQRWWPSLNLVSKQCLQNKHKTPCHPPISAQTSLFFIPPSPSHWSSFCGNPSAMLSSGTFCIEANIFYLCSPIW